MLGHTLIAIVDNIMVGKLGSTELAAVLYVVGHGEKLLHRKNGLMQRADGHHCVRFIVGKAAGEANVLGKRRFW